MLKKALMLGASIALALTAVNAQAGSTPYTIAKISGSVKVVYTDDGKTQGSTVVVKDGANTKGLIYLALGYEPGDKETAAAAKLASKNAVLALAYGDSPYSASIVVWDTVVQSVIGIVGSIQVNAQPAVAQPGEGTAGKVNAYAPATIQFGDGCFDQSFLSGTADALVHLTGKISANNQLTPGSFAVSGLVGTAGGDSVIVDGAFKGNLGKTLSTDASISCPVNNASAVQ